MNNVYVKHTVAFILLYVAQIFLLDKVALWGFVTPMIYILFILSLPFDTPNWLMVVLGFAAGLIMDSFTGSLGMHALSLMTIAFMRKWVITVIPFYGEKEPHLQPKLYDMKFVWYLQYTFLLTDTSCHLLFCRCHVAETFRTHLVGDIGQHLVYRYRHFYSSSNFLQTV